jgi:Zinc carboxypeptidase
VGCVSSRILHSPFAALFLGRIPGAPGEFVDSAKAYAYSRALAAASPRVRVFTIGRSEEGRDIILLVIADEKGIQNLDALKSANAALADPRTIDAASAERLIAGSRPFYYFNAALHSDETGSTESVLELAYRLAVSDQPMIRRGQPQRCRADRQRGQFSRGNLRRTLGSALSQLRGGFADAADVPKEWHGTV